MCAEHLSNTGFLKGPIRSHTHTHTHTLTHTRARAVVVLLTGDMLVTWAATNTTPNTDKKRTPMTPMGFEPAIPASDRPQSHALGCATTGTDEISRYL